jgi:hypothetical protein
MPSIKWPTYVSSFYVYDRIYLVLLDDIDLLLLYRGKNYLHPHTYLFIIAYVLVVVLVVEDIITMHDEGGILSLMYNGREGHSVISTSRSHITKVKPALSQACYLSFTPSRPPPTSSSPHPFLSPLLSTPSYFVSSINCLLKL